MPDAKTPLPPPPPPPPSSPLTPNSPISGQRPLRRRRRPGADGSLTGENSGDDGDTYVTEEGSGVITGGARGKVFPRQFSRDRRSMNSADGSGGPSRYRSSSRDSSIASLAASLVLSASSEHDPTITDWNRKDDTNTNIQSNHNNNNNNNNAFDEDGSEAMLSMVEFVSPGLSHQQQHAVVRAFQESRQQVGRIINNDYVQAFIIFLITINALLMGVATYDVVTDNKTVSAAFDVADRTFLIIFTVEIAMQLYFHGMRLFMDGWMVFDVAVVIISWTAASLQIVRAFRIFRAIRLVGRLKLLRELVDAVFTVGPSMFAIIVLLVLVIYVYAVLCTELFGDEFNDSEDEDAINYFGSLDKSVFTLVEMLTMEWAWSTRSIMANYSWAFSIFGPFIVITSFILYSLVIAVVCDVVKVSSHQENEDREIELQAALRKHVGHLEHRIHTLTQRQTIVLQTLQEALHVANVMDWQFDPNEQQQNDGDGGDPKNIFDWDTTRITSDVTTISTTTGTSSFGHSADTNTGVVIGDGGGGGHDARNGSSVGLQLLDPSRLMLADTLMIRSKYQHNR